MPEGTVQTTYDEWLHAVRLRGYDAASDPEFFRVHYDRGVSPDEFATVAKEHAERLTLARSASRACWIVAAVMAIGTIAFIFNAISSRDYITPEAYQIMMGVATIGGSIYGISLFKAKGKDLSYGWLIVLAIAPLWILAALLWPATAESRWAKGATHREPFDRDGAIALGITIIGCMVALALSPIVLIGPPAR